MFYVAQEICKILKCSKCDKFDKPKILPCGLFICSLCEDELLGVEEAEFRCICNSVHVKPSNKLPSNEHLSKLLECELFEHPFSRYFQERFNKLKEDILSSEQTIRNYCDYLRYEIDLTTESTMKNIQEIRKKLVSQVNNYEEKCLNKDKYKFKSYDQLVSFTDEINKEYENLNKNILDRNMNEQSFKEVEKTQQVLDQKVKDMSKKLNFNLFCGKKMKFCTNSRKINANNIGSLQFESTEPLNERVESIANFIIEYNEDEAEIIGTDVSFLSIDQEDQEIQVVLVVQYRKEKEIFTCDRSGSIIDSKKFKIGRIPISFRIFAMNKHILFVYNYKENLVENVVGCVKMYTYELTYVSSKDIDKYEEIIRHNNKIYSINNGIIKIYDEQFNVLNYFGQQNSPMAPFYIPKNSSIGVEGDYIYLYNGQTVTVLDIENGKIEKEIKINAKNYSFKVIESQIVILSKDNNTLSVYNNDGELKYSLRIQCSRNITSWDINERGDFLINDSKSGIVYLNDALV